MLKGKGYIIIKAGAYLLLCLVIVILFRLDKEMCDNIACGLIGSGVVALFMDISSEHLRRKQDKKEFHIMVRDTIWACKKFEGYLEEKFLCRPEEEGDLSQEEWIQKILFTDSNEELKNIMLLGGDDKIWDVERAIEKQIEQWYLLTNNIYLTPLYKNKVQEIKMMIALRNENSSLELLISSIHEYLKDYEK